MYSPQVLEHFQNPRNVGDLPAPAATVETQNPVCGDVLRLAVRMEAGSAVEVRFRARGCVAAIACASCLTEMMQGKTLAELAALRREDLIDSVGGLPPASQHGAALALDALHQLLRLLQND